MEKDNEFGDIYGLANPAEVDTDANEDSNRELLLDESLNTFIELIETKKWSSLKRKSATVEDMGSK